MKMDNSVCSHDSKIIINETEQASATYSNVNESHKQYIERKNANHKKHMLSDDGVMVMLTQWYVLFGDG